jgi:DNA invertase Pin-like site-specific DNA recombinase
MTTIDATLMKRLENAARKRKEAEETADKFRAVADELIVEGYVAGIPKQRLAEAAGLTRQTVYTVLRKAGNPV